MSDIPKRRNLLAVPSATPDPLTEEAIAAVAARNGFPVAAPQPVPSSTLDDNASLRRRRQPTGRDDQFNVRLRRSTLDFIYGEANRRNIPVAPVVEEMAEALKRQQLR